MPSDYPVSLDSFPRPTPTDHFGTGSVKATTLFDLIDSAIEAVEARQGIGTSTPKLGEVLVGTATGQTEWRIMRFADARDYADPTGVIDGTTTVQAKLTAMGAAGGGTFVWPVGGSTYRIDDTLVPPASVHIVFEAGVTVKKPSAASNTHPIFRVSYNNIYLTGYGGGGVLTEKNSPLGLILLGGPDLTTLANVNWCHVEGVTVSGVRGGPGNVGIYLWQTGGAPGSTYQNVITANTMKNLDIGVRASDGANANTYSDNMFYAITTYCFDYDAVLESTQKGGFVSHSAGLHAVFHVSNGSAVNIFSDMAMESGNIHLDPSLASNDIINTTSAHYLVADQEIHFLSPVTNPMVGGAGIDTATTYYVLAAGLGTTTFKFSTSVGGAAVDFTTDLSGGLIATARPYVIDSTSHHNKFRFMSNLSLGGTDAGYKNSFDWNDRISFGDQSFIEFQESTIDIGAPSAGGARMWAKDDGTGKTQMGVMFNNGIFVPFAVQGDLGYQPYARRTFSDANVTINVRDVLVVQTGTLTAPRTATLPAASAVPAGWEIIVGDVSGSVTTTNTITIARAGADTINGATSAVIGSPYGWRRLVSDGVSAWSFDGGILRASANLSDVLSATTARANLGASVGGGGDLLYDGGSTSTAKTINLANGNVQKFLVTANCNFTMPDPTLTPGGSFVLILTGNGSGTWTLGFITNVPVWTAAAPPSAMSGVSAKDVFTFLSDGVVWLGFIGGLSMA